MARSRLLTDKQVADIRRPYERGWQFETLAAAFKVGTSTIWNVVHRKAAYSGRADQWEKVHALETTHRHRAKSQT